MCESPMPPGALDPPKPEGQSDEIIEEKPISLDFILQRKEK